MAAEEEDRSLAKGSKNGTDESADDTPEARADIAAGAAPFGIYSVCASGMRTVKVSPTAVLSGTTKSSL